MRRDLMNILACPDCKHSLDLTVAKENEGEVLEGTLVCTQCGTTYPIENAIPNLLPAALRG
ncbi:MAG: methytransferase partner Trm112, partial [Dehalococcoidia bacterium]